MMATIGINRNASQENAHQSKKNPKLKNITVEINGMIATIFPSFGACFRIAKTGINKNIIHRNAHVDGHNTPAPI